MSEACILPSASGNAASREEFASNFDVQALSILDAARTDVGEGNINGASVFPMVCVGSTLQGEQDLTSLAPERVLPLGRSRDTSENWLI